MKRVQLVVMIDLGTKTAAEIERLKEDMRCMDWASLHAITQEGEDPEQLVSGGFNPERLLVQEIGDEWREEPLW